MTLNDVRLYGCLAETPRIIKSRTTGEYIRAIFHLAVVKDRRTDGENGKEKVVYDWPMVLVQDADMIKQALSYQQYDVIEIKGTFTSRRIKKSSFCPKCNTENIVEGNICYVTPIFMAKRNDHPLTEKEAIQVIKENYRISNNVILMGNLCTDVNFYKNDKISTATYQLGVDRKFFNEHDDPDVRTDWPVIHTAGKQAEKDALCIKKGSGITVEGYLHTREFDRESVCSAIGCGETYTWKDNTIEIRPYVNGVEYLTDWVDPETALKMKEEQTLKEGEELNRSLFGGPIQTA